MRSALLVALLVLTGPLVGCIGSTDGEGEPAMPTSQDEAGSEGSTPANVTGLEDPPSWEPGDWWTIEFHDPTPAADGATYTTTRVVTGTANGTHLVGMPAEDFDDRIVVWHMPGFGNVQQATLGYLVHGEPFKPLDFPLEEGKTWQTSFLVGLQAEVVETDGLQATVNFTNGQDETAMQAVYDGSKGFITELTSYPGPVRGSAVSHGSYEVVDHGLNYEGTVMVPVDRREVFFRGRAASVLLGPNLISTPQGEAEVPDDVDRVTLAHVLGELHDKGATTGQYSETTTTPAGETIESELAPGSPPGRHVTYHGVWDASGTWSFEHVAAGPGGAFAEGIGYAVENVTLPAP